MDDHLGEGLIRPYTLSAGAARHLTFLIDDCIKPPDRKRNHGDAFRQKRLFRQPAHDSSDYIYSPNHGSAGGGSAAEKRAVEAESIRPPKTEVTVGEGCITASSRLGSNRFFFFCLMSTLGVIVGSSLKLPQERNSHESRK